MSSAISSVMKSINICVDAYVDVLNLFVSLNVIESIGVSGKIPDRVWLHIVELYE